MAHSSSAEKRFRQSQKRRLRNRSRKARLKTVEKRFLTAVAEKNTDTALQALNMCFSEFDKSAKLGIIHANQANRKKARLSAKMMALGQPQVVAAAPAATPTTA